MKKMWTTNFYNSVISNNGKIPLLSREISPFEVPVNSPYLSFSSKLR